MRSRKNDSVQGHEVYRHVEDVLRQHLKLKDHGPKCRLSVLVAILCYAAARIGSIFDACRRLRDAPCDQAVRDALFAMLPQPAELTRRLNSGLAADLPDAVLGRRVNVAVDLTLIPYHGQPLHDEKEVYRGQPKHGTSHFHAYATCYMAWKGRRFTLAMVPVWKGDSMKDVLQRLLQRARAVGVKIKLVLLDRGFYSVEVIRYLQAARTPFLMPLVRRGRKPKNGDPLSGSRQFHAWKQSGWSQYTLTDKKKRTATVRVAVACRNYRGKWNRHGRQTFVYAYWGCHPGSMQWVYQTYRRRFGIESSYRQLNQARIRTCTRNPALRLLLVGMALILRNAWVWFHLLVFAERHRNGQIILRLEKLRFRTLLLWTQRYAEALLGCSETISLELQT